MVEIDESVVSKLRKYNKGKVQDETWAFGMFERRTGRIKIQIVPNRRRETLIPIIQKYGFTQGNKHLL